MMLGHRVCYAVSIFSAMISILTPGMMSQSNTVAGISQDSTTGSMYSNEPLGCIVDRKTTSFRLFAPRATSVVLVLFDRYDQEGGQEHSMVRGSGGVWKYSSPQVLYGKFYGYRVSGPAGAGEMFNPDIIIGDPYSRAVVTRNNYHHPAKTLILDTQYDWEGDRFAVPADHNRLVIYEAHLRDLTAHVSSGVTARGTFPGLMEKNRAGGLSYLKDLGVNAVEFQPLQKFGTIELPYRDGTHRSDLGEINTWNPYERNHWGYMTSYFFSPESYYATGGTMEREAYNGEGGRAVKELKDLVKSLHREGIAVIMDVVYNHVSQYDYNPFKYIDKFYYFRCDADGNFLKNSGCGNDFKTENPMARRLIVESVAYWMKEYHIDGFRFDLATMIDRETCTQIGTEARKINPNVVLIAEAWGGGKYDPPGFSDIGWASWNDQIRNGVKGQNPHDGLGFIFGKWQGGNTKKSVMSYVKGTLREDGGMFLRKEHSINYLESHDDNTLGDFIRLGTGEVHDTDRIGERAEYARVTPRQLALNKLAAMFLLTSQGPVMIHEGQEFARSKVIAPTNAPDERIGMIDRNSYEKDNETNWLNYDQKTLNRELYDYYRGLIELRRKYPIFGSAPKDAVEFGKTTDDLFIVYRLRADLKPSTRDHTGFLVLLNGNPAQGNRYKLPAGTWSVVADAQRVSVIKPPRSVTGAILVPPTSGMILMKSTKVR